MPRRTAHRPKEKWTDKMIEDAPTCEEKALSIVNSNNAPR